MRRECDYCGLHVATWDIVYDDKYGRLTACKACQRELSIEPVPCPNCYGWGRIAEPFGGIPVECPECYGTGLLSSRRRDALIESRAKWDAYTPKED